MPCLILIAKPRLAMMRDDLSCINTARIKLNHRSSWVVKPWRQTDPSFRAAYIRLCCEVGRKSGEQLRNRAIPVTECRRALCINPRVCGRHASVNYIRSSENRKCYKNIVNANIQQRAPA